MVTFIHGFLVRSDKRDIVDGHSRADQFLCAGAHSTATKKAGMVCATPASMTPGTRPDDSEPVKNSTAAAGDFFTCAQFLSPLSPPDGVALVLSSFTSKTMVALGGKPFLGCEPYARLAGIQNL